MRIADSFGSRGAKPEAWIACAFAAVCQLSFVAMVETIVQVVYGVSFVVNAAEIVGLLGRNGAGKTTTFRMVMGMIDPDRGTVSLDGRDISTMPMYQRARAGMGYLSQEPSIFQRLSVEDNLLAILQTTPLTRHRRHERCRELLEQFGLAHKAKDMARTCSGGERRKLEIARALQGTSAKGLQHIIRVTWIDEPGTDVSANSIKAFFEGSSHDRFGQVIWILGHSWNASARIERIYWV